MRLVRPRILVFLGPQGSGKGTQSVRIAQELGLPRAEAGQLFRDEAKLDTPLGRAIKALLDKGEYLPTELWRPVIERVFKATDAAHGMIFDGFLRTPDQLGQFDEFRHEYHLPDPLIVYLKLSKEHAVKRLMARGRVDDTPELIARRLEWSTAKIKEILDHFRSLGEVVEVDGDHPIEQVHETIMRKLADAGIVQ